MTTRLLSGVLLLACVGCAGPTTASRTVEDGSSWFIRLDTFTKSRAADELRYEHPADWPEADLAAILSRILVQKHTGFLEQKSVPQPLFSASETKQLVPGLQKAFRTATPSEWVAFFSTRPSGTAQEVTSGGMFLKGDRLHVVVANHHDQISWQSDSLTAARTNPLLPLGGKGFTVSFDPARFVSATQATWMGGSSAAPASELILDYQAYLAEARPLAPSPVAAAPVAPAPMVATPSPLSGITAAPSPAQPSFTPQIASKASAETSLNDQLKSLQNEVERLRRRLEEQDEELAKLKTRLVEMDMLLKSPATKKPAP
jgi:hypothetical protein